MRELALFAGAGGGILGGILSGWQTVCAVEIDAYCTGVLIQRQNDGLLPPFPIWDDVCTFDGKPWRGIVDVVSGGFPCQDISAAGKGAGIEGEKSGLWVEMARIVGEVRPRFVFVENSPMLVARGLGRVLRDLAEMGFNARWGVFSACAIGGPHTRERLFLLADSNGINGNQGLGNAWESRKGPIQERDYRQVRVDWIQTASSYAGSDFKCANRVDRLKALGNGQVPAVAATAWRVLSK